ncbi:MAG: polyribonucleotide nucleotidyltransferase [Candidatus Eisenbacteria bacterium]|uniref:Polyribonucleotide nucleotidyltransferase n=1 Tax=Eiseniibacteriota bacterium TaxID=2212470 RepID=A0A956NCN2_UNCEI|nr:polyribonucleotide nucleotidyltransferase [Candidatus Eisenbacteria bacterium]MCB9462359.1 polyribonucleotide nucleotidyltransferase [Candidatus Eisenbacteria bacterium]
MKDTVQMEIGGRTLSIETGRLAKQAQGACLVTFGETVVLCTVVVSKREADRDFLPLFVEYREKTYAAGRIPGGFFKREGRPTEKEILSSRIIDRTLRPMFEKSCRYEIQVMTEVVSSDQENDSDVIALVGASCAVNLTDMPFPGPLSAVRVGLVEGEYIINPTVEQLENSRMDVVIAGTDDSIVMVEGEANEISEQEFLEGLRTAHETIRQLNALQRELLGRNSQAKRELPNKDINPEIVEAVTGKSLARVKEVVRIGEKEEREAALDTLMTEMTEAFAEQFPEQEGAVKTVVHKLEKQEMRRMILEEGRRTDGRSLTDVRPISSEVSVLPRTHGSAVFTRGQTQALVVCTLGTSTDEQKIEELLGQSWKSFMLHYNFPPYSVGEVRPLRGPGRREIGHGALAERALTAVVPSTEKFPYTIRIVSDVLESNGSSSMASVCGGTLALMDAGVPIKSPVAGIAMGLIQEDDGVAVLSDILGVEDHLGDMDFKVAGTKDGITAIQMDIKIKGLDYEVLTNALEQARQGRLHILGKMAETMTDSRTEISQHAPRIIVIQINPDRIRDVIGPGGKVIRKICEDTGASVDVEDDGTVKVACVDAEMANRAVDIIRSLTEDPEIGRIYRGKVKRIVNFGAFVEILPGRDGLVHISELEHHRVARVEDVLSDGEIVLVKVIGVDEEGKIRLSRKAVLEETPA